MAEGRPSATAMLIAMFRAANLLCDDRPKRLAEGVPVVILGALFPRLLSLRERASGAGEGAGNLRNY